MISAIDDSVRKNNTDHFFKFADEIWKEMFANDLMRSLKMFTNDLGRDVDTWIFWSVTVEATAVRIIRSYIGQKNKTIYDSIISSSIGQKNKNICAGDLKGQRMDDLALVSSILVQADRLLDATFFGYRSLSKELHKGAEAVSGDFRSSDEMLGDRGYGTFSYDGRHGVLNTVLIEAAKEGESELLERLIEWGVQPLHTDDKRLKTALHHAAKQKDEKRAIAIAKELLKGPLSEKLANAKDYKGRTPLHIAAFCGHAHVCRLLLNHKASVFCKDNRSQIPLHHALRCKPINKEVIYVLISVIAEGDNLLDWKDDQGKMPLNLAEYEGINTLVWLLSLCRQPEAYFKKIELALCLRESSARGYVELVKKLLNAGADPLQKDQEGKTALHYAAECEEEYLAMEVVSKLYKYDMELVKA